MNDPKISDRFDSDFEDLRPSHDMLETAREIRVSPEEQEEAVAREEQRRQEQAARLLYEQAVVAFEAAAKARQRARRSVVIHAMLFVVGAASLSAINQVTGGGFWVQWPLLAWLLALAGHAGWALARGARAADAAPAVAAERDGDAAPHFVADPFAPPARGARPRGRGRRRAASAGAPDAAHDPQTRLKRRCNCGAGAAEARAGWDVNPISRRCGETRSSDCSPAWRRRSLA